ncbi:Putative periplasmic protein [hydrothermal vent metagenome]|uniref:Periplasmic protein n=1 Tax=hydrothermal vent metagenome TaxID=652676 RepID=A0A3B1E756_9ZZZZ
MKYFFWILLLPLLIFGRDNPFEEDLRENGSNRQFSNIYLQEEQVFLPSQARELESIIFQYKTLDGSLEIKKVGISNAVDWHLPIIIKQEGQALKKNLVNAVEYIPFRFIKYRITYDAIYIYTNQERLRYFHLPRPFKIVIDFDSRFSFKTLSKQIKRLKVVSITTGAHKGFFRVTILLDAPYKYTMEKIQSGYKINLK